MKFKTNAPRLTLYTVPDGFGPKATPPPTASAANVLAMLRVLSGPHQRFVDAVELAEALGCDLAGVLRALWQLESVKSVRSVARRWLPNSHEFHGTDTE